MEELGKPFEEESEDLLVLGSKEIGDQPAVEAVKKAQKIGQQQFQTFTMWREQSPLMIQSIAID